MSICLAMIVRDEAAVIRRCLESVKPLIDAWVVVDTGSTDDTKAIVHDTLKDLPGGLFSRKWEDFATNRTEALRLARQLGRDYLLLIDADDILQIPPDFQLPDLTADSYNFTLVMGGLRWQRQQLISNRLPWCYKGVLHEFLTVEGAGPPESLPLVIQCGQGGARRQDPDKYSKDAAVLERALETETDAFLVSRYTFYLAQSHRDAGDRDKAIQRYLERATQGHWQDEVYVSLLNVARLGEDASYYHPEVVLSSYARAVVANPARAEAYHGAALYCRKQNRFEEGYQWAKRAIGLTPPANGLFVEPWIYSYGILDELAISGFWSGHHREAIDACQVLLTEGKIPDLQRVVANANHSRRALLAAKAP